MASRPVRNSERLRQTESTVYASATRCGSRVFQASSARRTFWTAVWASKGGPVRVATESVNAFECAVACATGGEGDNQTRKGKESISFHKVGICNLATLVTKAEIILFNRSRAGDLIKLLRKIRGVPIDKLESACAVGGLVCERQPDDGWSEIGSG